MLVPLVALAYVCLVIWASFRFFRNPTGVRRGLHLLWICGCGGGMVLAALHLRHPQHSIWRTAAALLVFGVAFALFIWALAENRRRPLSLAWSTDPPDHLVTTGPYRWVRHPFYASYLCAWMGGAAAAGGAIAWGVPAFMWLLFYLTARQEESKFARSRLAAAHRRYRATTGMFVPRPARRPELEPELEPEPNRVR